MNRKSTLISAVLSFVMALAVAPSLAAAGGSFVAFDVAEDATRFVFDEAPVFEDNGFPAYGNAFVTQGYIYPFGLLSADANGVFNGVNADGSPEFPDYVIGEWTCRGWFIGNGALTATGPWVITHQLYNFDSDNPGAQTFTTDGYELVDINVAGKRAVTGGTGDFRTANGNINQVLKGFNGTEGVSLRFFGFVRD